MKDICYLRQGLIDELETINNYRKLQSLCKTEDAKKLFEEIIGDEMVHCGNFQYLIHLLCPTTAAKEIEGVNEANQLISVKDIDMVINRKESDS